MSWFTKLTNPFWRIVFWWKKRTGWIDLNQTIAVTGTVLSLIPPDLDGDMTFNVKLDPVFEKYITGFGGRLTTENDADGPSLHCEIEPWADKALRVRYKTMKVGDRVRVEGAWGFDGVHTGSSMWVEVPLAIVRHSPNVTDGWFEIHPVASLEIYDEAHVPVAADNGILRVSEERDN